MDKFCLTVINTGFRHNSNIDVFNFIFFLFSYNFYFFLLGQTLDALLMELTAFSWFIIFFFNYFYDDMISFFFQITQCKMHFRIWIFVKRSYCPYHPERTWYYLFFYQYISNFWSQEKSSNYFIQVIHILCTRDGYFTHVLIL